MAGAERRALPAAVERGERRATPQVLRQGNNARARRRKMSLLQNEYYNGYSAIAKLEDTQVSSHRGCQLARARRPPRPATPGPAGARRANSSTVLLPEP